MTAPFTMPAAEPFSIIGGLGATQQKEEFQAWINDEQRDPSNYVIAWADDQVAGMVLNEINHSENEASGRKRGYTDPIAVRRPWRKQGLATAMLVRSLHLLRQHGMSRRH